MEYDPNNVFAKILRKELPCDVVYEDNYALAFHDINPVAPIHVLVIPKAPRISFDDFCANENTETIGNYYKAVRKTIDLLDLKNGYRVSTNIGREGGQVVYHFHTHIIGGKPLKNIIPG